MTDADRALLARLVLRGVLSVTQALECQEGCPPGGAAVRDFLASRGWATPAQIEAAANASAVQEDKTLPLDRGSSDATLVDAVMPVPNRPRHVGRFEILEELGRGGMGVVFKAMDPSLNRVVALKVMYGFTGPDDPRAARFLREARTVASLSHPAIVPVHEVGEAGGVAYLAMDCIAGTTFGALRREGLPIDRAVRLLREIADALACAHAHGVTHRDVKPENILVDPSGRPFLTDFGLAKERSSEANLTASGAVLGTPRYMAPEQAEGAPEGIGPAADVYSFGVVLYEVITGRVPFDGEGAIEVLRKMFTEDVVPPSSWNPRVPRDLEAICLRCLRMDATLRYRDGRALTDELDRYLAGAPIQARRSTVMSRLWMRLRRRRIAIALVLLVAALVAAAWGLGRPTVGEIEVTCDPPDVSLTLGGRQVAVAGGRAVLRLAPGNYRLAADAPAFEPASVDLDLRAGDRVVRHIVLARRSGRVRLRGPLAEAEASLADVHGAVVAVERGRTELDVPWGTWRVRATSSGCFPCEATVEVPPGGVAEVPVLLDPMVAWEFEVGESVYSTPQLHDFDGDGLLDVWVVSRDRKGRVLSGLDGRLLAEWSTPKRAESSVAVDDLDGDGADEVVFGCDDGTIAAWTPAKGKALWEAHASAQVLGSPLLADLDGDGRRDVVIGSLDGSLYALAGKTGTPLWKADLGAISSTPALLGGDVVVAVNLEGVFRLRGRTGEVAWHHVLAGDQYPSLTIADLDGDGALDVLDVSGDGAVIALRGETGEAIWRAILPGKAMASPAVADMDGDGRPEAIFATIEGVVVAFDARSGAERWRRALQGSTGSSPAVADLDGDGAPEVVIGVSNSAERSLVVLSGKDGTIRREVAGLGDVYGSPVVGDVNGDGAPEVVFGSYAKKVLCLQGRPAGRAWTIATGKRSVLLPCTGGAIAAMVEDSGRIAGLSLDDGRIAWRSGPFPGKPLGSLVGYAGKEAAMFACPWEGGLLRLIVKGASADGVILPLGEVRRVAAVAGPQGAGRFFVQTADATVLVDATTGAEVWRKSEAQEPLEALVAQGIGDDADGDGAEDILLQRLSRLTLLSQAGRVLWDAPISSITYVALWLPAGASGAALVAHASSEQVVRGLDAHDGHVLWRRELMSRVEGTSLALPDVDGDGWTDIAIPTASLGLLVLSGKDGREIWRDEAIQGARIAGLLSSGGGARAMLVVSDPDHGVLTGLDPATGRSVRWQRTPKGAEARLVPGAASLLLTHQEGVAWPMSLALRPGEPAWPRFRHDLGNSGSVR